MFNANQTITPSAAAPQASLSMWAKPLAVMAILFCHSAEAWAWKECDEDQTADAQQFCSDRGQELGGCTDEGGGLLYVVCFDGGVPTAFYLEGSTEYPEDHEREDWDEAPSDADDADERWDEDPELEDEDQDSWDVEEDGDTGAAGTDEDTSGLRDRKDTRASDRRISWAEQRASIVDEDVLTGDDRTRSGPDLAEGSEHVAGCSTTGQGAVHLGILSLVALLGLARRQVRLD